MKISNNYAHIFENYAEYSPMMFKYWSSSSLIRAVSTDPHKTFLFSLLNHSFQLSLSQNFSYGFLYLSSLSERLHLYMYKLYIDSIYLYLSEWDYWKNFSYRIIIIYTYACIFHNIFLSVSDTKSCLNGRLMDITAKSQCV